MQLPGAGQGAVIVLGLGAAGLVIVWLLVVRLLSDHGSG